MRYCLFVLIVLMISCKEDESAKPTKEPLDGPMHAYINDEPWIPSTTASASFQNEQLSIGIGDSADAGGIKRIIYISLDTPQIGTVNLIPGGSNVIRYSEFTKNDGYSVSIQEGKVTLTKLDLTARKVSGTFTAYFNTGDVRVSITDGTFTDIELNDDFCEVAYDSAEADLTFQNTWKLIGFVKANSPAHVFDPPCGATIEVTFDSVAINGSDTLAFSGKGINNLFSSIYQVTNDSTIVTATLTLNNIPGIAPHDFELWFFQAISNNKLNYYVDNNILKVIYNDIGDSMLFYYKEE